MKASFLRLSLEPIALSTACLTWSKEAVARLAAIVERRWRKAWKSGMSSTAFAVDDSHSASWPRPVAVEMVGAAKRLPWMSLAKADGVTVPAWRGKERGSGFEPYRKFPRVCGKRSSSGKVGTELGGGGCGCFVHFKAVAHSVGSCKFAIFPRNTCLGS